MSSGGWPDRSGLVPPPESAPFWPPGRVLLLADWVVRAVDVALVGPEGEGGGEVGAPTAGAAGAALVAPAPASVRSRLAAPRATSR
jgi:hypothetical protein